ncbi:MAG: cytochrome P450 [Burkholderiales bacterium]|nr:cytochrome P450 [Opitutaceae bacterium]
MSVSTFSSPDPFREARHKSGVLQSEFQGENIPMILRHEDVRRAAKDWQTFSSDAPFKVPIPTEEDVRTVRQLPLEVDPPEQQDYREVVEPFFNRAKLPEVVARMEALVGELVTAALQRDSFEVVRDFAIPLQSRALAILLNVPDSEAQVWIGWGTHVFREGNGTSKGAQLEAYANALLDRGAAHPDDSFFSAITRATFRGRLLTREEMLGYCSIVFAGGRDTVINSITGIIAHFAKSPADLDFVRADRKRIIGASEEFFRVLSPVTHLARKCPMGADVHGVKVAPGEFASLAFSSANFDASVFDAPDEVRLDRRPNPHVAFGFGPHLCLGAAHARLVVRTLISTLCDHVAAIDILEHVWKQESEPAYIRRLAAETLRVKFHPAVAPGES